MKDRIKSHDVLFLCSGNYYRSRFAENFFNWLATELDLDFWAESRGFRLSPQNVGEISRHAVEGLAARGIGIAEPFRFPTVVQEADFEFFDTIVAVKETEHRPLMLAKFPVWANQIEYWSIDDIDCCDPELALMKLENQVRKLIARLQTLVRK